MTQPQICSFPLTEAHSVRRPHPVTCRKEADHLAMNNAPMAETYPLSRWLMYRHQTRLHPYRQYIIQLADTRQLCEAHRCFPVRRCNHIPIVLIIRVEWTKQRHHYYYIIILSFLRLRPFYYYGHFARSQQRATLIVYIWYARRVL